MNQKVLNPKEMFLYKAKSNSLLEICFSSIESFKSFEISVEIYDGKDIIFFN